MKSQVNEKYKWVIVGLSFLMVFIGLGFCSSSKGLYLAPITEALGIKRSIFSISDTARFVTTAVVNMFFGTLVARFGTKKLIMAGFLSLILSCLSYCFAKDIVLLCVGGMLLGLGLAWTTTTMVGCVINRWCKKNKGKIMGVILSANGVGSSLATVVITYILNSGTDPFMYRKAYIVTTIILAVMAALIILFYREAPKDDAETKKEKVREVTKGGNGYLYVACGCILVTGLILQGVYGISAAHYADVGISAGRIAAILTIQSLLITFTKFSTGFMYDKFGMRVTMSVCLAASVFAMLSMLLSGINSMFGYVCSVFCALALPLDTVMLPLYAEELAPKEKYNKFLGIFVSFKEAGYALGAIVLNLFYDVLGTYNHAFIIFAVIMVVVLVVMQYVLSVARAHKNA